MKSLVRGLFRKITINLISSACGEFCYFLDWSLVIAQAQAAVSGVNILAKLPINIGAKFLILGCLGKSFCFSVKNQAKFFKSGPNMKRSLNLHMRWGKVFPPPSGRSF